MLTVEKSSQTLVFFVIDNFVKSLLQNLGLKKVKAQNTNEPLYRSNKAYVIPIILWNP